MTRTARAVALLAAAGTLLVGPALRADDAQPHCGELEGVRPIEASERLVEGARVYRERCSPCHGDTGRGDGVLADLLPIRPRNYHADRFRWGTRWEDIERTVRLGRSGVMPAFDGAIGEGELRSVAFLVACWVERRGAAGAAP